MIFKSICLIFIFLLKLILVLLNNLEVAFSATEIYFLLINLKHNYYDISYLNFK